MDIGSLPGSAHLPKDLNCGLDWIVQCPFDDALPSTQNTVKQKRACGQSNNASRKLDSMTVVVIVETEIICAWRNCGAEIGKYKKARFREDWKRAA